jgi:hypothetical protein
MSRFGETAQRLAAIRRDAPVDLDLRDTRTAEVADTFYYSEDPERMVWREQFESGAVEESFNDITVRRRTAFEDPAVVGTGPSSAANGGYYEQRTYPVLRYNEDGELDWRFGVYSSGFVIRRDSGEVLTLHRTLFRAANAGEPDVVFERLHVVGPGGVDQKFGDHQVIASTTYEQRGFADGPAANSVVLYAVERATGFWARATNVAVIRFDDPADPNHMLREVSLLRGVGY